MSAPTVAGSGAQRRGSGVEEYPFGACEMTVTRVFDAPRDREWRMRTEPVHLTRWWGPARFTNPRCELELRPGGHIRIVMRGPAGTPYDDDFPMAGTFHEIVPGARLMFTAVAEDKDGRPLLRSRTTVTFEDHGAQTRVTVQAKAVGAAPVAPQMLAGMEQGWGESLEKLAGCCSRPRTGDQCR